MCGGALFNQAGMPAENSMFGGFTKAAKQGPIRIGNDEVVISDTKPEGLGWEESRATPNAYKRPSAYREVDAQYERDVQQQNWKTLQRNMQASLMIPEEGQEGDAGGRPAAATSSSAPRRTSAPVRIDRSRPLQGSRSGLNIPT
ncbi:hypothetical protein bb8_p40 [Bordetella phage vB_BbrP_BB8]|uniref:Uncharacterized protein n=1 Tax=Bordetella phage vB_BbrP_BB8 TaxID=2587820 RepID=A0A4Y5TNT0_9CAUD|nr:hypothetical protein bb8_p40 [Bordetella phage vB_BbrP_BB8]